MNQKIIFLVMLLPLFVRAQYTVFTDGARQGIKQNNSVIVKAKYETILLGDTAVFALYKNGTWEYVTAAGKQITAGKGSLFLPFQNGYGVIGNLTTYNWQSIDVNGNVLGEYYSQETPQIIGKLVIFPKSARVYNHYGKQICNGYRSFEKLGAVLVQLHKAESGCVMVNSMNGHVISEGPPAVKINRELWFVPGTGQKSGYIITGDGKILEKDILAMKEVKGNCQTVSKTNGTGLLNVKTRKWLIKPDGIFKIEELGDFFWAASNDSSYTLVCDEQGTHGLIKGIKTGITENNTVLVSTKNGIAMYTFSGNQLGSTFDAIYKTADNRAAIISKQTFAYINAQNGKTCSNFYPLYYSISQRGLGEKAKRFVSMATLIFAAPLTQAVNKQLNDKYSLKSYNYALNSPTPYQQGFAIVGVSNATPEQRNDSLFLADASSLNFVFIDSTGKEVSARYEDAFPFTTNWTWVKQKNGYQRINQQFKPIVAGEFFRSIETVWNGEYFIVEKEAFKNGIINSKGEWIEKPVHAWIRADDKQLVSILYGEEKVLIIR